MQEEEVQQFAAAKRLTPTHTRAEAEGWADCEIGENEKTRTAVFQMAGRTNGVEYFSLINSSGSVD